MTATKYERVLAGFQHGWAKLGNKRFNVVIFTPSYSFQNPDGSNNNPWNREKDYYIAEVRLPFTDDTDNRDNFTVSGSVYVTHSPYEPLVSKLEPDFAKSCELFAKLCHHAGAALPEFIRKRLEGYCPWDCRTGASWWIALLAHLRQFRVRNPYGLYIDEQTIYRPWLDSIRLIEALKLNTDAPEWFDEALPQDPPPNDGPLKPDGFCLNGESVWGLTEDWQKVLTFVWERSADPPKWQDVATYLGVLGQITDGDFRKLIHKINGKLKDRWLETLQTVRGLVVLRIPVRGRSNLKLHAAKKSSRKTARPQMNKPAKPKQSTRNKRATKK